MNRESARRTFHTALIWVSVAVLAFILWQLRYALLLVFGAVVVAILLRVLASLIARWFHISEQFGLAIAATLIVALISLMFWRFGSQLSSQFTELLQQVEGGEQSLTALFRNSGFSQLGAQVTEKGTSLIAGSISGVLSAGIGFAQAVVMVAIMAIYLAAQPRLYRDGIAVLFHPRHRKRVIQAIDLVGRTLKLSLLGQLFLMVGVGVLSFIALWLIGVPNAGLLAVLAGLAEIVPYIGPFLSATPAVLVALTLGLMPAVWTIVAYLVIHVVEGYVTAPLTQRYFVTIPPALVLAGIVAADLLFGIIGVVLAAPITVVIYMSVKMIYVDDPLEEHRTPTSHRLR